MKLMKKLFAALLVLCMMIPLFTVGSSAKTTKKYQGKSLVILGDSIAARKRLQQFFVNYDRLLSIIYRLNPDVEVYTMGLTYPFKGLKTINDQDSTLFAPLNYECIGKIRTYVTKQSKYAGRVKYIDCSDVGGHGFGNAYSARFLLDFVVHVHPDAEGHKLLTKHVSAAFNK